MKRENSYPALVAYLDAVEGVAFEPGVHDCALFVAGAVAVQTGVDHARNFRGKYKTIAAGKKLIAKQTGHADHIALVAASLDEIAPHQAQNGDIGMIDAGDGENALGVVCGAHIYVVAPTGLGIIPRTQIVKAWKV